MKYKVGDKIRVREDLRHGEHYDSCYVAEDMADLAGKVVEVSQVNHVAKRYVIKQSDFYSWTEEMFEDLALDGVDQLDELEVLSREWISENVEYAYFDMLDGSGRLSSATAIIKPKKLQNLLVPKQELPVIPKFVAEWIEETKPYKSLRVAFEYIAQRKRDNHDDKLAFWVEEGNSETFARAWLDGYEIEQEPKYYAKIKGHENIGSNDKYWNYNTDMEELSIGDSDVHPNVISEYTIKATKEEWANLGITDDNAEFELVEEIENE